ncbi:hypothetical protein FJM65_17815 [Pontibacter mangrovi]|uniref:CYTH domain-containing protein n=2 Tax=Pontibacter mangrovi TaxID=2589816 RepID=A0A501W301_9BACT|nr:hypothetical protein FJM65_17815 [Pontibacter mangrovi]
MGAESYLMEVKFKHPIPQAELISMLESCGATYMAGGPSPSSSTGWGSYRFEIRSELGLTELRADLAPGEREVPRLFLRFSILSPRTVIGQSFAFLRELRAKRAVAVYPATGAEDEAELELDEERFLLSAKQDRVLATILGNEQGLIIEGGETTIHYIYDNELVSQVWGSTSPRTKQKWWQKLWRSQ